METQHINLPNSMDQLFTYTWKATNPMANLLIVHGGFEHAGRYQDVASFFANKGYNVFAYDHRYHGQSSGEMGYFESFQHLIDDLNVTKEWAFKNSNLPNFILSHSLGGLVTFLNTIEQKGGPKIEGYVYSAPGLIIDPNLSPILQKLSGILGRLVPKLATISLDSNFVSRDQAVRDKYNEDPLNYRGKIKAKTGFEVLKFTKKAQQSLADLIEPFIVLQGTEDKLIDPRASKYLYEQASSKDKTLKQYPGLYHEILNEPERHEVMDDMLEWMQKRMP